MENAGWMLLGLLASHLFLASSQDMDGWKNIDCGSDNFHVDDRLVRWDTDAAFTQTGENKQVQEYQSLKEMRTLRAFPYKKKEYCYSISVYKQTFRYLVRAGFYYGNYDGLSMPPTFDLYIDGEMWATVDTASNGGDPAYHEAIYVTHRSGLLKLCLVETEKGKVPFISSIEVVPLTLSLYPRMETSAIFHQVTRTNFGGDEIRFTGSFSEEKYNRIWTRGETPSYVKVSTSSNVNNLENDPPSDLLSNSIRPLVVSDPIILTVDFPQLTPRPAYFVLYFSELEYSRNPRGARIMQIKINGQYEQTVVAPEYGHCKVVTIYPVVVVGPIINITLASTGVSTLPPMIAGMEVFTKQANGSNGTRRHFCFVFMFVHVISLVLLLV